MVHMKEFDVRKTKRKLNFALKRVKNSQISKQDKDMILKFHDYAFTIGLSKNRMLKYLDCLRLLSQWLDVPFKKASKDDIIKLLRKIEQQDYTEGTKKEYKVIIKRFYKWLNGDEEYPDKVKWIKATIRKNKQKLPKDLITKQEVEKMIRAAYQARDKAMVALAYESGFRIGELLSLPIKNLEFDEYGAKVLVPEEGKTGMRRIRLVSSVPYLATWIENHPFRDTPEAPLWVKIHAKSTDDIVYYENALKIFKTLAKRADIKKRIYPHLFRHTRATQLANHLTEAQMDQYFGWIQGSDMPSTYVHLSGRDLEDAILKFNGLNVEEKENEPTIKKCPRCEKINPNTGRFCLRCGAPLDFEAVMKVEEKRNEMDNVMTILLKDLLKDPEIQARIENKLKQIGST